ncbi:MAG TPA: ATP-binding protein [Ktedonobacteraceae bacterium]|nr:ATP-binding protein [Ktedonobacteraceae bacterium]
MAQQSVMSTQMTGNVVLNKQSYKNILYLLLSFFLGVGYFVMLLTGIVLGIGTLVIWIGVPILFGMVLFWWQLAAFERLLAIKMLGVPIAPMSAGAPRGAGFWRGFQERLGNEMTWKTLAYLFIKFPLGLFCFVFALVLPILSFALGLVGLILGGLSAPFYALIVSIVDTQRSRQRLQRYLTLALSAFGLNIVTFYLLNGLAYLHGQIARGLLGMSDTALRLETAKVQAAQARAEAEQAEQRRRELVVNVSHELRAPVASISGHLESLLLSTDEGTKVPEAAQLHNYLNVAYQEARRLGTLVDDLLSLARMESHELRLQVRDVAVHEVVEEVYQTLMPLAQRDRQVTLVRGVQPNLSLVRADRQRLGQVLTNLVRNAITSTPAGGIVSISLEQADAGHLSLVVEDSGVGIPADELQKIFDRFYRTDTSRSRKTGGFGLGLAIVHELVTAMGGSISVTSAVGQGSRFCVLLRKSGATPAVSKNADVW